MRLEEKGITLVMMLMVEQIVMALIKMIIIIIIIIIIISYLISRLVNGSHRLMWTYYTNSNRIQQMN